MLQKMQHITPSIHAMLFAYILSATLRSILYSVPLIRSPLPIFYASSGFPFSPIHTHPILRGSSFFFYATTLAVIYTVCIYFTARRKTSRPLPATALPSRTGDCHPLWARTLSRPLSRSWPVPAGYKPSRDNYRDTKCVSARKSCVRTPRWHLGTARFTVFM